MWLVIQVVSNSTWILSRLFSFQPKREVKYPRQIVTNLDEGALTIATSCREGNHTMFAINRGGYMDIVWAAVK